MALIFDPIIGKLRQRDSVTDTLDLKGSDTYANIILIAGAATGDLWASTTADGGAGVAIGDGIVWDGTAWQNAGRLWAIDGVDGTNGTNGTNGTDGTDGVDTYTYIAYASDNAGTGWSLTPTDALEYRAEIHSAVALTPVEADFAGATWVQYLALLSTMITLTGTSISITRTDGDLFEFTPTAATAVAFNNFLVGDGATLIVTNGNANLSFPSYVIWQTNSGLPPTLQASGVDMLEFVKTGTNIWGYHTGTEVI